MSGSIRILREAPWLTAERARGYCRILLALTLLIATGWIAFSRGGVDPTGKPIGTDFISFWTASKLALHGRSVAVYHPLAHHAAEIALFGRAAAHYTAFFYPPVFLLFCLPLATLPYLPSLICWLGVTGAAYWKCLRAILPQRGLALALLAYPAVFLNAGHGQNGFLTAALFGGAMLSLEARPGWAGVCFGSLIYKPHLGILIPFALIAAGRWKTLIAAAATSLSLILISILTFGTATWRAFFAVMPLARVALEHDLIGDAKMPTAFAALRLLHGGIVAAFGTQFLVSLGVSVVLIQALRARPGGFAEGALIAAAALIVSPFLLDYDLMALAVPLAWVMSEALQSGFLPWEKSTLAAGFVLPLVSRTVAGTLGFPLGPPVLLAVFCVVLRRVRSATAASKGAIKRGKAWPPESLTVTAFDAKPPRARLP